MQGACGVAARAAYAKHSPTKSVRARHLCLICMNISKKGLNNSKRLRNALMIYL